MKTKLVLKPGSRGARKLLAEHGVRLVRVRYRYDEKLKRRYKTVELIEGETAWDPPAARPAKERARTDL